MNFEVNFQVWKLVCTVALLPWFFSHSTGENRLTFDLSVFRKLFLLNFNIFQKEIPKFANIGIQTHDKHTNTIFIL